MGLLINGDTSQLEVFEKMYSDDKSRLLLPSISKMYSDGIFINGTAKTLAPYLDTYLPQSPNGQLHSTSTDERYNRAR
ncbi:hypothetical protein O9929_19635 [Vibrio lentus]|nr:hypothetical protein [Vibrio lentus]